jgi:hypothetical protein
MKVLYHGGKIRGVKPWMRAFPLLLLSLALIGAPCAHCTIQPAATDEAGHDCCPKQKQNQEDSSCTWMPAQYVAPGGITPGAELAEAALPPSAPAVMLTALPVLAPSRFDEAPPPPASPPLYLVQASLLI